VLWPSKHDAGGGGGGGDGFGKNLSYEQSDKEKKCLP
jgi:hypothetical protein